MAMIPRNPKGAAAPAAAAAAPTATKEAKAPEAGTATNTPGPAAGTAGPTTTAVAAAPAPGAVSTRVAGKPRDVITEEFKDKMPLEWNTLHRIQCNQGQFLDMENGKKGIGVIIEMELMTFQDSWQISPGSNDPEATELVRYSDDGITTNQGENCVEYLNGLKEAGWDKAKIGARVVLAGILTKCDNPELIGRMIQMDLSTTSKAGFDRHRFQASYDVSRGLRNEDALRFLKLTAKPMSKGQTNWTQADFTYGTPV